MNSWQLEHIEKNLPALIGILDPNELLLSRLVSDHVITDYEKEEIQGKATKYDSAAKLLDIVRSRNCYEKFVRALDAERKEGAATILKDHSNYRRNSSLQEPPPSVAATVSTGGGTVSKTPTYVNEYISTFFGTELTIQVRNNQHNVGRRPSGKGKALIISIGFYPAPSALCSSDNDRFYMTEIFRQLGYEICGPQNKNEWSEKEFIDTVKQFRDYCDQAKSPPEKVFVYISGHGTHDHIVTSEKNHVSLLDHVFGKFDTQDQYGNKESSNLGSTQKLFIIDACQVTKAGSASQLPIRQNMYILNAQIPRFEATAFGTAGSYLTHCVAYVFMNFATQEPLKELVRRVNEIMVAKHPSQIPVEISSHFDSSNVYLTL